MQRLKIFFKHHTHTPDGRRMTIVFGYNDTYINVDESVEIDIDLPGKITLEFSGKLPNDTIVDEQGNITSDLAVEITGMTLDGFSVSIDYLKQNLCLQTATQIIRSCYIGFNGTMTIDFKSSSIFQQLNWFRSQL